MKIGVLAVQGAFLEHEMMLKTLGAEIIEIRKKEDAEQEYDGLILPGGESTVMGKLLKELNLFDILQRKIKEGLPVFGTCAGLILLAEKLTNDEKTYFKTLPVSVKRNAYGRQLGSFCENMEVKEVGKVPMTFIRAPYIEEVREDVNVLSVVNGNIVAVRYKNQLGVSFHPELTKNKRMHRYFLKMVKNTY